MLSAIGTTNYLAVWPNDRLRPRDWCHEQTTEHEERDNHVSSHFFPSGADQYVFPAEPA